MNRHVLKAVCVLIAVVIWIQVATSNQVVREADLELRLEGLPAVASLHGSTWPETVHVRATGSEWSFFLNRFLGRSLGHVSVDLSGVEPGGSWTRDVTANDVVGDLSGVVVDPPCRLELYVDRVDSVTAPISVATTGGLPSNLVLTRPIAARPGSVLVRGPSRRLRIFAGALETEPLDLGAVGREGETELELVLPDEALSYGRRTVTAVCETVEILERTFVNVPVVPLTGAAPDDVEVSPPVISVIVAGPVDDLRDLTMSDITVTVAAETPADRHGPQTPEVSLPTRIRLVNVDPATVVLVPATGRYEGDEAPH